MKSDEEKFFIILHKCGTNNNAYGNALFNKRNKLIQTTKHSKKKNNRY